MRLISLLALSLLNSLTILSQNKDVYVFKERYNNDVNVMFDKHHIINFKEIKIFGQYMIDPLRDGNVDYSLVDKYLDKLFPNINDSNLLVINLEGKLYTDLRCNYNNNLYEVSSNNYQKVVKYIKLKRPNLKVGFYGIPFPFYYDFQKDINNRDKLDGILSLVDVIFPSLYIYYPMTQKGLQSNYTYLKNNLDIAFEYANKFDKPVIPFVWYLVHPSNKQGYSHEVIPKKEMHKYIKYIQEYESFSRTKIDGIVWWDSSTSYEKNLIHFNLLNNNKEFYNVNYSIDYYFFNNKIFSK